MLPCTHGKLNVKHHRTTPKPAIHTSITADKDEAALAENSIEHQNVRKRRSSSSNSASICIRVYTNEAAISTNPRSIKEECAYGMPSGKCFPARRLEVVAVAGLLRIYFVVRFFVCGEISFFFSFSFLRTHTAYCKYEATCLIHLSTSTGVRTGCHHLISVSLCVRV